MVQVDDGAVAHLISTYSATLRHVSDQSVTLPFSWQDLISGKHPSATFICILISSLP
jgi:hypothetical protein